MSVVACTGCDAKIRVPAVAAGIPRCPRCRTNAPWLVAADDRDFALVIDVAVPVLVDLWAPWCGPCRSIAPVLEQLAHELAGRLKVVKVNVDEAPRTAARFDARGVPTLVVLRSGEVLARQTGALPRRALIDWVHRTTALSRPEGAHPRG